MKKTVFTFLLTSTFTTALLLAQGPGGPGPGGPPDPATSAQRRVAFLTTQLTLTTDQQQQATGIFTSAATSEAALRTSLQAAHQSINDAVKANDTAAIDQAATTIGNLTAQSTSIDAKANAAFYRILTADQQAKFAVFPGPGRGPGPGMGPDGFRRPRQ